MAELEYITAPLAALRSEPDGHGPLISELLHGEQVRIVDRGRDWTRVENLADRHTGYVAANATGPGDEPTHVVTTLGSFLYRDASFKSQALGRLSFLSKVAVADSDGDYARTAHGYLHAATIAPMNEFRADPVTVARMFAGVPYKWGGRSSEGLDCSSLTQLAFAAEGIKLPKNAGPQRKVLQSDTTFDALESGDLLFLPGHVMIWTGANTVIHADGKAMMVREMPLDRALADRNATREKLILKRRPTPEDAGAALKLLRHQLGSGRNPIDRDAFLGLSGPDIMS